MTVRILTIAAADLSGASGLEVDMRTAQSHGAHIIPAITGTLMKNKDGTQHSLPVPPGLLAEKTLRALVKEDVSAIKIGCLPDAEIVNLVADVLDSYNIDNIPVVADLSALCAPSSPQAPEADHSACDHDQETIAAWKRRLLVKTRVLTPGLSEAGLFCGTNINDIEDMRSAARIMRTFGAENIVLRGGTQGRESGQELYFIGTGAGERIYERPQPLIYHPPGSDSAFSCSVTIGIAQGMSIFNAVEQALNYIH